MRLVVMGGSGACLVLFLAWLPFLNDLQQSIGIFASMVNRDAPVAEAASAHGALQIYAANLKLIGRFLVSQPFLLPLILLGAMTRRMVYTVAGFRGVCGV